MSFCPAHGFSRLFQATKLLKASILKVDVGDLELDEDEYAAEVAAGTGPNEANPDLDDLMQQHGINREQQQPGAARDRDVEMQDAAQEQQENIPPAGGSQQQQGEGGEKQQQAEKQAQAGTQQQQAQARKTTTISADKYEFVKVSAHSCCCCCWVDCGAAVRVLLAFWAERNLLVV